MTQEQESHLNFILSRFKSGQINAGQVVAEVNRMIQSISSTTDVEHVNEVAFIGEISISDLRKLFAHRASRIIEETNQGAIQLMTLTDFKVALADMRWRIYNDGSTTSETSRLRAELDKAKEEEYQYHFAKRDKMLKVVHNFRRRNGELSTELAAANRRIAELEKELGIN
jgi:hypothetical protein